MKRLKTALFCLLMALGPFKLAFGGPVSPSVPITGIGNTTYTATGFSTLLQKTVNVVNVEQALNTLFEFSYTAPGITLTSVPGSQVVEDGSSIASIALTAYSVANSSPITVVTFYRNGNLIDTVGSPNPSGGSNNYTDSTAIASTTSWTAKVTDNVSTTTSNAQTITFVYPFFYGVGAPGLTMVQIAALTKLIQIKTNSTITMSPSNQVYYFAYPAAYGSLTSIIDQNGFNVTGGYTQNTYSYTAADGTIQSYYAYVFNSLTTQTNFKQTFNF